ncbi:MAG: cysteine desulfurase [Acidobacteria bacterium]|nr:cysteine desulfurase [Acidobacteriota bacterium]
MFRRVYLDNSATTPVDPDVLAAMMPYLTDKFGNASSIHFFGQETKAAIDKARHQVAALINSRPNEIVFTSGGTEANNLAVRGLLERNADTLARMSVASTRSGTNPESSSIGINDFVGRTGDVGKSVRAPHIITSAIEHPAVKSVCEDLEKQGFSVTYLPVYDDGLVRVEDVKNAVRDETILISVMFANNEIGTIQPVHDIGRMVRDLRGEGKKIWFHTDAVQAAGKVGVDVEEIGCDLLSVSAHKINAPKGVGALYIRRGVRLHSQNIGGRQERGVRGGTESVPLIAAFGTACEIAKDRLGSESLRLTAMRDRFENAVLENIPDSSVNGAVDRRLPNISNISFRSIEGEGLLINLDMQGIAVSTGSACSSGSLEPSPVIRALGKEDELARGAIRFSFGTINSEADVDRVLEVLPGSIDSLRNLSPKNR